MLRYIHLNNSLGRQGGTDDGGHSAWAGPFTGVMKDLEIKPVLFTLGVSESVGLIQQAGALAIF